MDPQRTDRRSVSPKPGTNPGYIPMGQVSTGAPAGSQTILSSILRAPHPNLQKRPPLSYEGQHVHGPPQIHLTGGRGHSPIRVITTLANIGETTSGKIYVSPKGGLSPSRVPITLPPKKSLSPSRAFYSERRSVSPKQQIIHRNPSPSSSSGGQSSLAGQGRQKELLSHLPYLSKSLQGGTGVPAEGLFQQYKTSNIGRGPSPDRGSRGQDMLSSSMGQGQPRPAHQGSRRTPTPPHVSTIRRTPSPAHMPIGSDVKGHIGQMSKPQGVNLVKAIPEGHEIKLEQQVKWDAEYKFGDLLQSINKSHEIQSHLLQRALSPITPADTDDSKLWLPHSHALLTHPPPPAYNCAGVVTGGGGTVSYSHGPVQSYSVTSAAGGFAPVPASVAIPNTSTMSSFAPVGFTPVVLPSQTSRKSMSPKSQHHHQSMSPKPRYPAVQMSNIGFHGIPSQQQQRELSFVQVPVSSSEMMQDHRVKVFPGREPGRFVSIPIDPSVTQAGPPNVTITSSSSIFMPEKTLQVQKHPRNPFTFPATPPVSLTNEKQVGRGLVTVSQSKQEMYDKQRHVSGEMPCLMPVSPMSKIKVKSEIKTEIDTDLVEIPQPYNMRLQTLANFPNNQTHRPTYRATSVAIHKAKVGCITNSAKSLDLLRQNLQKCINKDIDTVIQSYMEKYFKYGIENIRLNNGETAVTDDHIQAVSRQILEEAKKMYLSDLGRVSVSPAREISDTVSETGSSGRRSALGRRRHPSDTDSEAGLKPGYKKKKGRYIVNLTGRSTPSKLALQQSKREGPKFEPDRLTEETEFVMGSRANKAMGFGATRGRLYMKHPDLYKYSGDQDDKTWLYEHQHMPATGGKSYIIVLQDIKDLVITDEYRDTPGINIDVLMGFTVPMWMIEKMRVQMVAMRTDLPKQAKYRSRSATPNNNFLQEVEAENDTAPKSLPFSSFSSPKQEPNNLLETSPADEELDFLTSGGDTDDPASRLSPFNLTGGFDDTASQSDIDTLDDETSIEPSFTIVK